MKVEAYYSYFEVEKKINVEFDLTYHGQDWDIVNADSSKVQEFINYYLRAEGVEEKVTMFALLIASIDEIEEDTEIREALNRIEEKVFSNLKIHLNTIIYWALIGHGKCEEHIFKMTNYMRLFLNEKLDTDKIEGKSPDLVGIEINGLSFLKLLGKESIDYEFSEFIDYLNLETDPENAHLEISEEIWISCEKEDEFTHLEVWSPEYKSQYFKFRTKEFEEEIKSV